MIKLIATYFALLILLAAAVAVPYLHLGSLASFAIASAKMILILAVFMQILKGSRLYILSFALGLTFFILLIVGTTVDFLSRPFTQ